MASKAKLKIKKGDEVVVVSGRDAGIKGNVLKVMPKERRALVEGVNRVKRHTRASSTNPGGIVEKELPIHISNLSLVDPKTGKPTRVGYRMLEDGRKVRFAKRSGEIIDV